MYVEEHNKFDIKNKTVRKCCISSEISLSLLGKENDLNSQDLTTFSENPYINFLMKTALYQVFFLHAPEKMCSTGRSPELIQSFSRPWVALEIFLYFFQPDTLRFPDTTDCQERSCSEEIHTYGDNFYFIWCRLWSFWENLPQSTNTAGERTLMLGMTFCWAAQYLVVHQSYNTIMNF